MSDTCTCGHPRRVHADHSGLCWVGYGHRTMTGPPCECMLFEPRSATSRTALEPDDARAYPRVMDATETCPNCDGEGIVADHHAPVLVDQPIPSAKPCSVCGGKGVVEASGQS